MERFGGLIMGIAMMALIIPGTHAATLDWSADGVTVGGDGTWDTNSPNWGTGSPYNLVWTNANLDTARFPGSGHYTVTLGADVSVDVLAVSGSGARTLAPDGGGLYSITIDGTGGGVDLNTGSITCDAPIIVVGDTMDFRSSYVINGPISGSVAILHNFGSPVLNGDNSGFSGGFQFANGTLTIGHDNALGTGAFSWTAPHTIQAGGGDRLIANTVSPGNWNYGRNIAGAYDFTFTGNYEVRSAFGPGFFASLNVQDSDCIVTFTDFATRTSGSNGGFKKLGPGTMVLSQSLSNTGGGAMPFTIEAGSLFWHVPAPTAVDNVAVTGGTLGGTGTIKLAASAEVTVTNGAGLAPGASVGTLTITNGPLNFAESAIYEWDYESGAGDLVQIYGDLVLPSVATVNVTKITGTVPDLATIFSATSLSGPGFSGGLAGWVITGDASVGASAQISGTDVILKDLVPPAGTVVTIR